MKKWLIKIFHRFIGASIAFIPIVIVWTVLEYLSIGINFNGHTTGMFLGWITFGMLDTSADIAEEELTKKD